MSNTTWNPADTNSPRGDSSFAFSNGNLTIDSGNSDNVLVIRSVDGQTSGKYYFEVTVNACPSSADYGYIGIGDAASSISGLSVNYWCQNGYNGTGYISATNWAVNDVLCFSFDISLLKIWVRKNGGSYVNNNGGDPALGTGGSSFTPSIPAKIVAGTTNTGHTPAYKFTLNSGDTSFTQTVPSGFTPGWPAAAVGGKSNMFFSASPLLMPRPPKLILPKTYSFGRKNRK